MSGDEGFEHAWHKARAFAEAARETGVLAADPSACIQAAYLDGFELAARFLGEHPEQATRLLAYLNREIYADGHKPDVAQIRRDLRLLAVGAKLPRSVFQ